MTRARIVISIIGINRVKAKYTIVSLVLKYRSANSVLHIARAEDAAPRSTAATLSYFDSTSNCEETSSLIYTKDIL